MDSEPFKPMHTSLRVADSVEALEAPLSVTAVWLCVTGGSAGLCHTPRKHNGSLVWLL